jgi:DNA primase
MKCIFNATSFYKDHNIKVIDSGKHYRQDWVNIDCPWCRMNGGLGINKYSGAVKCWGCGNHSQIDVIKMLIGCDFNASKDIQETYSQTEHKNHSLKRKDINCKPRVEICQYPTGTEPLTERHKAYLAERGFNAEILERTWGLVGTGNIGDYKFRIIAPIIVDGRMVSYQGRDITGKAPLRYKACRKEDEVIDHQNVVYGLDLVKGGRCVIVEGIADAWRFGAGAVCCFGIAFTTAQVNLIAKRCSSVFVLFDAEEQAQKQARELAVQLNALGVEVELVDISDTEPEHLVDPEKGIDPGNLKQAYANLIKGELEL